MQHFGTNCFTFICQHWNIIPLGNGKSANREKKVIDLLSQSYKNIPQRQLGKGISLFLDTYLEKLLPTNMQSILICRYYLEFVIYEITR